MHGVWLFRQIKRPTFRLNSVFFASCGKLRSQTALPFQCKQAYFQANDIRVCFKHLAFYSLHDCDFNLIAIKRANPLRLSLDIDINRDFYHD